MSTVNNKLTNLADEIRVLSGTTEPLGLTEMATNVNDANDEVADQTDLIAQVVSALQGKSVPGGGEDVTAETATYTDLLTDLEAAIDELPDAGSGSGGAAIETCSVCITYPSIGETHDVLYTTIDDQGNIKTVTEQKTVFDAVANTLVFINYTSTYNFDKAELVVNFNPGCLFKLTAQAGETVTIIAIGSGGNNN